MFAKTLIAISAVASLVVPTLAVPRAAWIRRQEDAQKSLTLDPAVISPGLAQDGQGDNPDPGQVRSLTSTNNFINFCLPFLDQGIPLTNGKQIVTGSCNPTPIGRIISLDQAPRCKFVFPKNGDDSLVANQAFTVQLKIRNMQTGFFVNAQANYYGAPQQVNDQGIVKGHSHVVIELLPSIDTTEPLDPLQFKFFKGLNDVAQNDILTASISSGLAAGAYRMCSINTGANHQPTLVSNAQHGTLDDCVYFTVKEAGQNNASESATQTDSVTATNADINTATETATAKNDDNKDESDTASATETASDAATETSSTEATATEGAGNNDEASPSDSPAADSPAPEATEATATESEPAAETPAPNEGDQQQQQPEDQNNNGDNANNDNANNNNDQSGDNNTNTDVNPGAGDNQNADNGNGQNTDNGNGQNTDNGNGQNTDNGNNQNADNGNNQNADNGNNQNADNSQNADNGNQNADNGANSDNSNNEQNTGAPDNGNGAADNNGATDNGADAQQN